MDVIVAVRESPRQEDEEQMRLIEEEERHERMRRWAEAEMFPFRDWISEGLSCTQVHRFDGASFW